MSKIEPLESQQFINPDINSLFENVEDFAEQLSSVDFLKGSKLDNITITTTGINFAHGLDSKYVGFFVLNRNSTAIIYTEDSLDDFKFIKLKSSVDTVATIWVF